MGNIKLFIQNFRLSTLTRTLWAKKTNNSFIHKFILERSLLSVKYCYIANFGGIFGGVGGVREGLTPDPVLPIAVDPPVKGFILD